MQLVDYLPSPLDIPPVVEQSLEQRADHREAEMMLPMSALVFKIVTDPYVGRLHISGFLWELVQGSTVYNSAKISASAWSIIRMYAERREDHEIYAGNIGAVLGLKGSVTGDFYVIRRTLYSSKISLSRNPVISVSIEPKTVARSRLNDRRLRKLSNKTNNPRENEKDTGQTINSGMG
jgi:elongation factor G